MSRLGEKIQYLRIERGLKQKEMAQILQINRATLSNWETGRANPDPEMLAKLAEFFNVTTDFMLSRKETRQLDVSGLRHDQLFVLENIRDHFRKENVSPSNEEAAAAGK
ncbi:MAG: helix-turn-helix domain-containing protein [Alkaliphilus sp.]|nr:helix-turn-helix domain-containing protein [Alkaliphilus sp.]